MNRHAFLRLSAIAITVPTGLVGCEKFSPLDCGHSPDADPLPDLVEATVTKGPWLTILAPGTVRLRFETREDVAVPVVVHIDDWRADLVTTSSTANVNWAWGFADAPTIEDVAGTYTVHDVIIEGIAAGATLAWEVRTSRQPKGWVQTNPLADGASGLIIFLCLSRNLKVQTRGEQFS